MRYNDNWKNLTPSYQFGGKKIINKEAAKHGATNEQKNYALNLYKGASNDQKKDAVNMYNEYSSTGNIPDGAQELYESVGGDSSLFARKGGAVGPNRVL